MTLLSDRDIHGAVDFGGLVIEPFVPDLVQPSSVDVRLGGKVRVFASSWGMTHWVIDPYNVSDYLTKVRQVPANGYVLKPGNFILASTLEYLELPNNIAARLEGKSTLGRLGLSIHTTAGFIDPGFKGTVTLEVHVTGQMPVLLRTGMKIGQLCFFRMSSEVEAPYGSGKLGSHYQDQSGPTPPQSLKVVHESAEG